jgi:hypothetical protein
MFTDDYGSNSEQCLPFSGIDTVWAVPPEPDEKSEEDYRQAHNRGYRYAAAFFIFTMRNGSERVTIHDVMKSMAEDKKSPYTQQCFWSYLQRLMWMGGSGFRLSRSSLTQRGK